jgi:formylglycine-generating enzyme required for sulfatase activity
VFDRAPRARAAQCANRDLPPGSADVREENDDVVDGIKGLMGNVSEWTATAWIDGAGRQANFRVVRGASHVSTYVLGSSSARQPVEHGRMKLGLGFRCAR